MTAAEWLGIAVVTMVMVVGLIGALVPGIPGAPLILVAAIGHKLYFGEASASILALGVLVMLTILSLVLDFLGSLLGAKKLGATWKGMLGAIIGAIVGIFFSLPGIILGPILGAFLFELIGGREWRESARAGAGALLGLVLGALGRIVCCVLMIAVFCFSVLSNHKPPATTTTPATPTIVQAHGGGAVQLIFGIGRAMTAWIFLETDFAENAYPSYL